MVRHALVAGFCLLSVTCGGGASASSRIVDRSSLPASLTPVRLVIPRIGVDARIADLDPANNIDRASVTGSNLPGLPNNGVPRAASSGAAPTRPGWGGVIAAGSLLVVVVVAVITAAKRRKV